MLHFLMIKCTTSALQIFLCIKFSSMCSKALMAASRHYQKTVGHMVWAVNLSTPLPASNWLLPPSQPLAILCNFAHRKLITSPQFQSTAISLYVVPASTERRVNTPSNKAQNLAKVKSNEGRLFPPALEGTLLSTGEVPLISETIGFGK